MQGQSKKRKIRDMHDYELSSKLKSKLDFSTYLEEERKYASDRLTAAAC